MSRYWPKYKTLIKDFFRNDRLVEFRKPNCSSQYSSPEYSPSQSSYPTITNTIPDRVHSLVLTSLCKTLKYDTSVTLRLLYRQVFQPIPDHVLFPPVTLSCHLILFIFQKMFTTFNKYLFTKMIWFKSIQISIYNINFCHYKNGKEFYSNTLSETLNLLKV